MGYIGYGIGIWRSYKNLEIIPYSIYSSGTIAAALQQHFAHVLECPEILLRV